jgi:hypothetical protein
MWKLSLCAAGLLAALAWAQQPQLPAGGMQQKATTACTECHSAEIVVQQRLSKPAWAKEVDKMAKWGALVNDKDREALIEYLSSNFPADKPPYAAPRNSSRHSK